MEKETKTYFIVEIGGADFYFEKLQDASDFFAKLVSTNAEKIDAEGYGANAFHYKNGKHHPTMKQEVMDIYPTLKAARFAKSNLDKDTE